MEHKQSDCKVLDHEDTLGSIAATPSYLHEGSQQANSASSYTELLGACEGEWRKLTRKRSLPFTGALNAESEIGAPIAPITQNDCKRINQNFFLEQEDTEDWLCSNVGDLTCQIAENDISAEDWLALLDTEAGPSA